MWPQLPPDALTGNGLDKLLKRDGVWAQTRTWMCSRGYIHGYKPYQVAELIPITMHIQAIHKKSSCNAHSFY